MTEKPKKRMFPLQCETPPNSRSLVRGYLRCEGGQISWHLAELAYRTYREKYGNDQSLEKLAERGGFGVGEFAVLVLGQLGYDIDWTKFCPTKR